MHSRKETRLAPVNYKGPQSYFVTVCCDSRRTYLAKTGTAERVIALLRECAANESFLLHAYCAMPDHLHFLAEGTSDAANLQELVRIFKLCTSFEFRQSHGGRLWQRGYYDHILRRSDSIEEVACYIWWNPVRKHLCGSPQEFPYSGSLTIPWIQRARRGAVWCAPWKGKGRGNDVGAIL